MTDEEKKKKKKRQSQLEAFVFQLMQKCMKEALDSALDDLLKAFK